MLPVALLLAAASRGLRVAVSLTIPWFMKPLTRPTRRKALFFERLSSFAVARYGGNGSSRLFYWS